jgi:hypothetical protein
MQMGQLDIIYHPNCESDGDVPFRQTTSGRKITFVAVRKFPEDKPQVILLSNGDQTESIFRNAANVSECQNSHCLLPVHKKEPGSRSP